MRIPLPPVADRQKFILSVLAFDFGLDQRFEFVHYGAEGLELDDKVQDSLKNVYRVQLKSRKEIHVIKLGIGVDEDVEGIYSSIDALPNWVTERLAVLMVIDAKQKPTHDIEGVGRRISETVFWVFIPEPGSELTVSYGHTPTLEKKMANKKSKTTHKVIALLEQGFPPKAIAQRLGIERQRVYSIKYMENKKRGLGALGKATPKPTAGIGAPPQRRRVRAGTGIPLPDQQAAQPRTLVMPITMEEPETTVLGKVWERFKNLMRALRG